MHKLRQEADGRLSVSMPERIAEAYGEEQHIRVQPLHGMYEEQGNGFLLKEQSGVGNILISDIPGECMVEFDMLLSQETDSAGIMVKVTEEGAGGYYIRLEPGRNRFLFDREPCYPHEKAEIERFVEIDSLKWHSVRVILDGTCMLAYLDDKYALSARMYDFDSDKMMFFVNDGEVSVRNLKIRRLNCQEKR